ncbi:unnamed protein product [Cyprideis torosa]|uniref:Translocation protein SEC62 n=1 Tax=Cyprideis torosa TaxID=163714 RepID=A0A7R8ZMI0_9CRUS|nr:unnamed protein product [Cyprideis torosa]CAG0885865.1 unnamed protein product [Cyprideis torosa]
MERKKGKKKGKQDDSEPPPHLAGDKPSKEMYKIAGYLRKNVPTKKTKFLHHTVDYFIASAAVDAILESPWGSDKGAEKNVLPLLQTREAAEEYLQRMLELKFFHRARKVPITERDLRRKALKKFKEETEAERKKRLEEEKKKKPTEEEEREESAMEEERGRSGRSAGEEESGRETEKKDSTEKTKRRRIKLDMHLEQVFVDGKDAYVWIWESTPWYYWILSTILVIATVGLCLFPLWPSSLRLGVYYLSIAAGGFLLSILCLALLKLVIFALIWVLSLGKHHFWILPNLTEDVGFFASFWPLYKYEYKGPVIKVKKKKTSNPSPEDKDAAPSTTAPLPVELSEEAKEPDSSKDGEGVSHQSTPPAEEEGERTGSSSNGGNEFEMLDKPCTTDEDLEEEEGEKQERNSA